MDKVYVCRLLAGRLAGAMSQQAGGGKLTALQAQWSKAAAAPSTCSFSLGQSALCASQVNFSLVFLKSPSR